MCGRFVSREQAAIEREYNIRVRDPFERVYNAAPSMLLPVIRQAAGLEALPMRWGLVPAWWSQPAPPTSTINARSEEAAAKPMWRHAVRHARALVPALGWYEWRAESGLKQPFYFHAVDGDGLSFAGLWSARTAADGSEQLSFAILTRAATPELARVHARMPVVLPRSAWAEWLAPWPDEPAGRLQASVAQAREDFEYYPVSRHVNSPRNQGEGCISPLSSA